MRQLLNFKTKEYSLEKDVRKILKGGGVVLLIKVLGMFLILVCQVFLARWMGVTEYGIYNYVFSWLVLITITANLGLPSAAVRFVALGLEKHEWHALGGFIRWCHTWTFIASVTVITLVVLFVYSLDLSERYIDYTIPLLWISIGILPYAFIRLSNGLFRGLSSPVLAFLPEGILRPLFLLTGVGVLVILGIETTATHVAIVTVFIFAIIAVGQIFAFRKILPAQVTQVKRAYEPKAWLAVSLPLLLVSGFQLVIEKTDVLVIGALLSPDDVGIYHAASRLGGLITIILASINALTAPRIAALHGRSHHNKIQKLIDKLMPWYIWPSIIFLIILVVFGEFILEVFGSSFTRGYLALLLIGVGQLVNALAGPVLLLLNMTGSQNRSASIFAVVAVTNFLLNFSLVPIFGIEGAAIATSLSMIIWNIWMVAVVKRRLNIVCHALNTFSRTV